MKKSFFALPALVVLLGVGTTSSVHAETLPPNNGPTDDPAGEPEATLHTLRELMHDGKIAEAKAFAQAHGLPGLRHGRRRLHQMRSEDFSQLAEDHTRLEAEGMDSQHHPWQIDLSDQQKDLLDQARKLHQRGDDEGARSIIDALDLPYPSRPLGRR